MPGRTGAHRVAVALFLLLSGIYALTAGGHTYSSDEEGMLATTRALVERRSVVLEITDDNGPVTPRTSGRTGEPVGVSGLGQSLIGIPLYLVGSLASDTVAESYVDVTERVFVGWTNSAVTAAGAILVFLVAELVGARRRWAVALALTYALGTMAWPHSKTFFSEPLATTLVLAATYFAVRATQAVRFRDVAVAGAFAGLALIARSSTGLFAPVIGLYLLLRWPDRRSRLTSVVTTGLSFGAGAAIPVALLLASNWWRFGSPLDFGYESVPLSYPIHEGLYGLFLSPGKSLFLYAPAALVGLVAVPFAPRRHRPEVALFVALGAVNALFFARFFQWHGDHAWGPRYLVMSLPFFVLPVAPLLDRLRWRRALGAAAVAGVLSASLGTVMYFNQYFHIVERARPGPLLPEGPSYWRPMHYEPYWSPIAGHVRALPDVFENSLARLDGEDEQLQPFEGSTVFRYGWYFAPPQLDSWAYWLFPTHGPKTLLLMGPVFLAVAGAGGVALRRALQR